MATKAPITYTPEEYLAFERRAEYRSEYVDEQIYERARSNQNHNLITVNLASEIGQHFKGRHCNVFSSAMRVKISATGVYTYPDLAALCGEAIFEDKQFDTLTNPAMIVEVLSASTEAYDRGDKFAHYRRLPSLQEYVLVSQDKVRVEHYLRHGNEWIFTELSDLDDALHLTSIDCAVAVREIYDKVDFEESNEQ